MKTNEQIAREAAEVEALAWSRTALERTLASAPDFDGYYMPHRKALTAIKALGIEPIKLETTGL